MIDRKRGRIFGVNVVDLLIALIVLFAIFSYISRPDEAVYRGNQLYIAIQDLQRLDSRGFLVEAEVTGTYLWDNTPFHETGILLPSTAGRLRLRKRDGTIVVIGGERAYIEDVAASIIKMEPLDSYLVAFELEPRSFEGYSSLISYLESLKEEMGADHLYLDIEIAVDSPMTPAERQEIVNELNAMYLVKAFYLPRADPQGFVINVVKAELSELADLNIPEGAVRTSRIRAYAGYSEEPHQEFPQGYHNVSVKGLL